MFGLIEVYIPKPDTYASCFTLTESAELYEGMVVIYVCAVRLPRS
ncbi:hypothetical protein [Leptolyngbya sp. FACHB-321]|nr:hypothetical protein [Leptolyngbya sp. FACHB-321]